MKAIILAAGEGRRLRPLTNEVPKPMIPICGRSILEHTLAHVARHGISEVAINLHHCPDTVTRALGDGSRWGISITYSFEPHLLGTAGTVMNLRDWFDDTVLVIYGDNLTTCDLTSLIAFHQKHDPLLTMAVHYRDDPTGAGIVEVLEEGRIGRFLEKPAPEQVFSHWVNAGLLVVSREALRFAPSTGTADLSFDVIPALLRAGEPARAYCFGPHERLWWIDTPQDLQRVEREFSAAQRFALNA